MLKRIVYLLIVLSSITGMAQNDSLVQAYAAQKNLKELQQEQQNLNFEKFFFKALSQKAIGNHDKAIIALEKCQAIKKDDTAVNFELSKNYYALEKYFEAITYVQKALEKEPNNIFLLEHLKDIYVTDKNFKDALSVQQKIVIQKPLQEEDLIILYIRNNQIESARNLIIDLEKKGMLSENLIPFKQSLMVGSDDSKVDVIEDKKPISNQSIEELKENYNKEKTFALLNQLLIKEFKSEDYLLLEKDSQEALELFPAQPFVYLMHGKALNKLRKYEKAITILQNGIDYVIDDYTIEADFYDQLSLSYKGLSKNVDASKYLKMATEARQKKSQ